MATRISYQSDNDGKSQPEQKLTEELQKWAKKFGCGIMDLAFARSMDTKDPLKELRNEFVIPKKESIPNVDLSLVRNPKEDCIYMCGHALGLQPKGVKTYVENELKKWGELGFYGHFLGELPWAKCDEMVNEDMAKLVGAKKSEVAVMNGLTVNLHLMMISFYRPTKDRHKVLMEDHAFPTQYYVAESQIQFHGFDPKTSLIQIKPKPGHHTLSMEDISAVINKEGSSIALVLFSGVQFYTGQLFDIKSIAEIAHNKGCMIGFDLAHTIGNVPLELNKWDVDFAVWCTYKYLNSGAGSLAGAFMHEKHANNDFPKLVGWWGHNEETRFDMISDLDLSPGIAGYRITNPSIMAVCPIRASLDLFNRTSMEEIGMKSKALTGYLEYLIKTGFAMPPAGSNGSSDGHIYIEIITPSNPEERGSQLSLLFSRNIDNIYKELMKRGICCDQRKPNVLRIAPNAMYNTFEDVWHVSEALHTAVKLSN